MNNISDSFEKLKTTPVLWLFWQLIATFKNKRNAYAVICIYDDSLFSIATTKVTLRLRIAQNTSVMKIAKYLKLNPFQTKIKLASNIH